jgi:uracil-DNA glycosylase family 4
MDQLTLLDLVDSDKEDIKKVLKELSSTCGNCRLSIVHPDNRGIIWRGNPQGRIAVIGEAPGDKETEMGMPLVGNSGKEWERWASRINLDTKNDCFLSNVVQCQPPKKKKDGKLQQRPPEKDELKACFGSRCLRMLRAMPNLEVVITLGWVAAQAILGGEPKARTHEGMWFTTNILPDIPVFCLVHPSYILRDPNPEKSGRVNYCLDAFKREFLDSSKIKDIVNDSKE